MRAIGWIQGVRAIFSVLRTHTHPAVCTNYPVQREYWEYPETTAGNLGIGLSCLLFLCPVTSKNIPKRITNVPEGFYSICPHKLHTRGRFFPCLLHRDLAHEGYFYIPRIQNVVGNNIVTFVSFPFTLFRFRLFTMENL